MFSVEFYDVENKYNRIVHSQQMYTPLSRWWNYPSALGMWAESNQVGEIKSRQGTKETHPS